MGLFKKQRDPFSQRAADLNDQIAAIEAQIRELSEKADSPAAAPAQAPTTRPTPTAPANPAAPASSPRPRLRSTARPLGQTPAAAPSHEPIFEPVDQARLHEPDAPAPAEPPPDLGMRRNDLGALWERVKNHFRGPATTNPKLVSYLAAGSIQGLRPLRYEKRVARNRFIVLFIFLALALWGLSVIIFRR